MQIAIAVAGEHLINSTTIAIASVRMFTSDTQFKKRITKVYTRVANRYDESHSRTKAQRYFFEVDKLKILKYLKGTKILELGAGTGRYGIFFSNLGYDYTGIDITPAMLDKVREKDPKLKLILMDAEALGFKENSFDSVFCDRTFKFFPNPVKVLKEVHRVLKPNGRIVISFQGKWTVPYSPSYWFLKLEGAGKKSKLQSGLSRLYSLAEVRKTIETAGFDVIGEETLYQLPTFIVNLLPSFLLKRLLLKWDVGSSRALTGSHALTGVKSLSVGEKKTP